MTDVTFRRDIFPFPEVGAYRGGVVFSAGPHREGPDRPAIGHGDELEVAAVVVVFAGPARLDARGGSRVRHWSVSTSLPSMPSCR